MSRPNFIPNNAAGVGLRAPHYRAIVEQQPPIGWLEALTDNYLGLGGLPLYHLEQVREHYPITLHGVGMSLGSTDPLDQEYLSQLDALAKRIQPAWISEHLAWTSVAQQHLHALLPLPFTEEVLDHVAARVRFAQDRLQRRLLIENPSSYLSFRHSEMSEAAFLCALVERADCELLIDVNNLFVSSFNNAFDATDYLEALPRERVKEIHLAGYEVRHNYLLDSHNQAVHPPVWSLYRDALAQFGPVPTLIEWDTDIPTLESLVDEAGKAQTLLDQATC